MFHILFAALVDSPSVSLTEGKEKARDKEGKLINTETVMDYSDKSGRIETSLNGKTIYWGISLLYEIYFYEIAVNKIF